MPDEINKISPLNQARLGINKLLRHIRQKVKENFGQFLLLPAGEKPALQSAYQREPATFAELINNSSEGQELIKLLQQAIKPNIQLKGHSNETNQEILQEILEIIGETIKAFLGGSSKLKAMLKAKDEIKTDGLKDKDKANKIKQIFCALAKRLITLIRLNHLSAKEAINLIMQAAAAIIAQYPELEFLILQLVAEFIAEIISAANANLCQDFSCENLNLLSEAKESKLDDLLRIILRNLELAVIGLVNESNPETNQAAIDLSVETLGDLPEISPRLIKFWHLVDNSSHSTPVKELLLASIAAALSNICLTNAGASLCLNELANNLLNESPDKELIALIIKSLTGDTSSPKKNIILKLLDKAKIDKDEIPHLAALTLLSLAASLEIIIDMGLEERADIASEELRTLKEILNQKSDDETPFQKTSELLRQLEQEDKILAEKISNAAQAVFGSLK